MAGIVVDRRLRGAALSICVGAAGLDVASVACASLRPWLPPATYVVASVGAVLFLRVLCSRIYRDGIKAANRSIQGDAPWPGKRIRLFDPEWGLFGWRVGTPTLLWVRAILFFGFILTSAMQPLLGRAVANLWFVAAFVSLQLSIMHGALSMSEAQNIASNAG